MPSFSRLLSSTLWIASLILATRVAANAVELPADPEKLTPAQAVDAYLAVHEDTHQTDVKRRYAAAQIMKLGEKGVPRIMELYRTADRERRGCLADILCVAGKDSREVREMLLDDLKKQGLGVHFNVVKALGDLRASDAVPELLKLYPRASRDWRPRLLLALGGLADPAAADVLFEGLDDEDRLARMACANGLVAVLMQMKEKGGGEVPRDETYRSLRDRMIKYIESGRKEDMRLVLIAGLGRLKDPQPVATLRRLARIDTVPVRTASVKALGEMKAVDAVDDLIQALYVKEDSVRGAAVTSLTRIGDLRCVPALIEQLGKVEIDQRRDIVQALRQLSGQRLGDNPDQWTRWWREREGLR